MRRTGLLAIVAVLLPRLALACPVCFGASDGPMLQGSNMGILALLVVTLAMLGAFAAFIASLVRRSAQAEAAVERAHMLTASAGHPAGGQAQ